MNKNIRKNIYIAFFSMNVAGFGQPVLAQNQADVSEDKEQLEPLEVKASVIERLSKSGRLKDTIKKTEVIDRELLQQKNASSLAESIDGETGINVSNECSMCGVKRVMIDGMKGEHSTILIDGLPIFSYIAGFYGVDAFPVSGIETIDVARGPGSSLASPEAIGGSINIVTKDPLEKGVNIDVSAGNDGFHFASLSGQYVTQDGRTRALLAFQDSKQDQWDEDENGVNESPALDNQSLLMKIAHDVTDHDTISFFYQNLKSEVFGGPVLGDTASSVAASIDASLGCEPLFAGNNINNRYIGDACGTTESIITEMQSGIAKWTREFSPKSHMDVSLAYSDMTQDSFYEGEDYFADDDLFYFDARFHHRFNGEHYLTIGVDLKNEEMRSTSVVSEPLDSFDNESQGVYFQHEWTPNFQTEVSMALRIDKLETNFIDTGNAFEETLISPRMHVRYDHSDAVTSRFAIGRGFRVPLSFFEADHGILADGFAVNVDEIEKSVGLNYALSYESDLWLATASLGWSEVENLAYIDTDFEVPTLVNSDEKGQVLTTDLSLAYDLNDNTTISASYENFDYDAAYEATFGIAPIERRLRFEVDVDWRNWELYSNLTHIGERDLAKYGYVEVYNDAALTSAKGTLAEDFWLADLQIAYKLTQHWKIFAGANNLFDYTQTGELESPLFYDSEGAYDVGHIWGPLRGRQLYAGFRWEL